jgi:hypothetical protein
LTASRSADLTARRSADLTASSRHNVGRFRCPYGCRSCRASDCHRSRAGPRRSCGHRFCRSRVSRRCWLQSRRCRDRSSARCLARHWNAYRRESPETARGRRGPTPRPGHTGIGRKPLGRPTRRHAHANPRRRHHPSRRQQPANRQIRQFSHRRSARFAVDLNVPATGTHRSGR